MLVLFSTLRIVLDLLIKMLLAFTALNLYQTLIFSARLYELLFLEFCKRHLYVKVYMLYVLDCKVVIRPAEG